MKNKEFFVANLVIALFVFLAIFLTFGVFSNEGFLAIVKNSIYKNVAKPPASLYDTGESASPTNTVPENRCSKREPLPINPKNDPHLLKLAEYQDVCGSFVTDTLMIFSAFPENRSTASQDANALAVKLKTFYENGIHPIVIVEPYAGETPVDYKEFLGGSYDAALEDYFHFLSDAGITKEMMGMWVPFPESNTPNWENKDTEPRDFALVVNKYMTLLQGHFPGLKGSVLLNSSTYDPNDLEWNNGDYLSLNPYLEDMDNSLVGSFGIQGFPWVSNATSEKKHQIFRASEFLQPDLAISSAQEIRTKDIWLNTGTFAAKYASDETKRVEVSLNDRKGMLNGILEVAKSMEEYQLNGYRVSINLFSEDKSDFNEATDWSYFQNEDSKTILREFFRKAEEYGIPVSLFDIQHRKKEEGVSIPGSFVRKNAPQGETNGNAI